MASKIVGALRAFLLLVLIILGSLLAYTFLHESGHALTAFSLGGQITAFNVNFLDMSAHVGIQGEFPPTQNALINISGAAFPFIVWIIGILAVPRQTTPLVQVVKGITSLIVVNTLLAWIALPVLYLFRCAPPSDDVTQFLGNSQAAPINTALLATGFYALGWFVTVKRIDQPGAALSALLKMDVPSIPGSYIATTVAASALLIVVSGMSLATCLDQSRIPAGFELVKTIDLSAKDYTEEPIVSFTLTQPERVGFLLRVQNINTDYVDIVLIKANGAPTTLLHGEGFLRAENTSEIEIMLGTGDYQVMLSSRKSPGDIRVYLKRP